MSKNCSHGSIWYRLRRKLSGVLCLALLLGLLPGLGLPAEAANWAEPYAQQLVEWGVMRGDVNGNLNLNAAITRAEFATLINRAYGYEQLGPTPFTDVSSRDWYYEDIGIAYNIGYFKGTSATAASPRNTLTREQAAVMLSRNLMLQETVGETLGFSDSRTLEDWSRGLIGAAVAEGVISGYSDGSFQPKRNISRGEVAAMLVRAIGTPIQEKGDYSLGSVYGNVTINSSGVALRDTVILGNLYLTGGIDLGDVLLENVNVLGRIVISGGGESNAGENSVILRNVQAKEMVVDSVEKQFVTIRAEGVTDIPTTSVRTNAYVDDSSWPGYGLSYIELNGESGTKLQLAGNVKEVRNMTPFSDLQFVQGSAEKVTVDEYATGSRVLVDSSTRVEELNLDVATNVTGNGDIKDLNVDAEGSNVEILPDNVAIRPGITSTIKGEVIDSTTAAEMSAEPKLLAGYPMVKSIAPTTATGVFSTNKSGTVYWAISAVADGSVSEADLIENPAYGGNIYEKQSGSIAAAKSNTEYTSAITKLLPDGSYYISAIMVDGQGRRSPLKVAAFTTPDDTVPDFNKGYPVMTKITTEIAQVTVMTNKSCQLYYALLPGGSTAPTPQEFKANSISGNWGYGSVDAVKNTTLPIKVNRVTLQEKTTYDLYLWLTDYNGANSSKVVKLTFTTPDETPPIVTSLTQTDATDKTAKVTYSLNEPGTLYWAIVTEADHAAGNFMNYDLDSLEAQVKVEAGTGAIAKGSSSASKADTDINFTISNLNSATTLTTSYILYYVAKDKDGNYSTPVGVQEIHTLDTTPPTVTQHFTDTQDPTDDTVDPFADTDIRLTFSENVQGGVKGDKKFLELYNNVLAAVADNNPDAITNARNELAAALRAHISLLIVPRDAQEHEVTERTRDDQTEWTIDWRYAEVEMDETGQMVVVLPTVSNEPDATGRMSALNLESGATYYFKFRDIYDMAYGKANAMGAVSLDPFTTVYADVTLRSVNLGEITVGNDTVRLDMCMSVTPNSTSKVAETENWDMILWSDTSVSALIYRQVIEPNGTEGNWELLNGSMSGSDAAVQILVNSGQDYSGISLYGDVMYQSGQTYFPYLNNDSAPVKLGGYMEEGYTYRYGIHFTQVGLLPESSYDSWSQLVHMKAGIVAGGSTDLGVVAGNVDSNYDNKIADGSVKAIGTAYNGNQIDKILVLEKQFTDREVPKFESGYPRFTSGSSTIHMEMNLDRDGTIYYVVAPADVISTTVTQNGTQTSINKSNDGTTTGGPDSVTGEYPSLKPTSGLTYIPTGGIDRENNTGFIAYTTGNPGYDTPSNQNIINPSGRYGNNTRIKFGSARYTGAMVEIDVTGLEPSEGFDTVADKSVYYVYFVLQGGGNKYSTVQCYRVTMDVLSTPSITVNGVGSTVTMSPDAETEVSYTLVELNSLPSVFRNSNITYKDANGKDATMNVLTAMMTPLSGRGGETYFDRYGGSLKKTVLDYVLGNVTDSTSTAPVGRWTLPNRGAVPGAPNHPDYVQGNEEVTVDFETLMTSPNSEYVLLAVARNRYGGEEATDYGYGAVRALYTPDKVPPDITTSVNLILDKNGDGFLHVSDLKATGGEDYITAANPQTLTYNGTITITFTKELYYHRNSNNTLYEVWPGLAEGSTVPSGTGTGTTGSNVAAMAMIDALGGSAVDNNKVTITTKTSGVVSSVTLKLNGISHNDTIIFFGGGSISNGSDYSANKTLTLQFDATLKNSDYNTGNAGTGTYLPTNEPGFRVSWK